MPNLGIIDLGSNSIRLILMKIDENGSYKLLDEIKETARIGENMGPERVIKGPAVERAVQTIKLLQKFCRANRADNVHGVATAAIRYAVNGGEVLETIMKETGVYFRILSDEEEARYEYLGVVNSMEFKDALLVDIGGGSTELILCRDKKILHWASLPFGAVNLTENYLSGVVPQPAEIRRLEDFLKNQFTAIPWLESARGWEVIGIGGTVRNLGRIDRKRTRYSLNLLHNYRLHAERVKEIYQYLQTTTVEERKAVPGLSKERADIILAGVAAIAKLLDCTGAPGIRVSGEGLREGIFYEYLFRDWPQPVVENVTEHSVQNFMDLYQVRRYHAEHVAKLSLSLFDQLQPLHGYGLWERKILRIAALLHDVGNVVSYYNHHKHTMYVLLNARLNGLSHRELVLVALVAACHDKMDLKFKLQQHADVLFPQDGNLVRRLGVLLRMAENLDRTEAGVVQDVVCTIKENEVQIDCIALENADLEIRELYKKVTNFNKVFGKKFKFPKD
ncbi:Ppx/GppA phosphatase family protein [Desulforamulus hydrothermalis]|uniref:Ppx/GppA phosphatase n=1 Tax=Desulforamulus hydrothermalis Lam5 = DSM 18033 TaxID=1121428 RepID=K8E0M7_9FIRM|nr:Ppx/GppA phosphatase family protein [Desulforamulus hydrothermalis]CCO09050.1 Ppx/GppA phosphatase [Desulforamulus hydrothermalis Lam5 = DSM 18033]SHG77886.1 exopolyphosphatase / guanosine-5'-triphosphate,3'-diphosphate pyrophosphatase [Desulforamulus hydrothermalis Lam5 = DSM 18033]